MAVDAPVTTTDDAAEQGDKHTLHDVIHALIDRVGFSEADAGKHHAAIDEADEREAWEGRRAPVDYSTGTPVRPSDPRDAQIAALQEQTRNNDAKFAELQRQMADLIAAQQNVRTEHVAPAEVPGEPVNTSPTETPQEPQQ